MSRGQCQGQNPAALSPSLATHSCWLFANLQMPRRLSLVTPDVGQTASPSPRKHGDLSGPLLSAPVSPPSPAHRVLLPRGGPALARRNAAGVVGKEGLWLSWWGAPGRVPAHPLCGATKEQLMFTKHLLCDTVAETDHFICPACITCSQSANCRTLSLSHGDWSSRNG